MIDTVEMREIVQNLLNSQRLAVLSTQMSGRPYSNLIAFVATADLKDIIFATTRATRKYANLTAEPRVSLLMDNRSNEETDFGEASAVTVLGTAEEVMGPAWESYLQLYLKKHPYLEEFVTASTWARSGTWSARSSNSNPARKCGSKGCASRKKMGSSR